MLLVDLTKRPFESVVPLDQFLLQIKHSFDEFPAPTPKGFGIFDINNGAVGFFITALG